ncbi:Six-hairpin glycosidase-like protein [Stenotrophomonas panacihumi]|uniref:Six-hairpin glycosidase-like protein n=1 Tax=Stenotrophomonas panacihumi TaxID=676599 RepID=A0A0R0AED1_9GAMM|nr:Six-hairpin glycosidase-like protein [Stenotrophomonas panacihumi]KRG40818.1 Six-hairpin glycosidase-like protein [Stenotrophomonas panacihumi]PTN55076.1 Six-hairpin glycosidase-like protein [Stenotrophomonas panacihumi]
MLKMICLAVALGTTAGPAAAAADLEFDGRHARAEATGKGGFVLHAADGEVRIAAQPMHSETGSVLFDALFALAQQEMDANRVDAIRDPAFDEGRPVPCPCFQTGARWPYVWTRDMSFAADLALARMDPQRTRQSLRFKLSPARDGRTPGLFVAQDTGSGGSWPISTDRVVWFLAARDLLDDPSFAEDTWQALQGTLAQDRQYAFDASVGLYRGETSFLDWREQTYPGWTAQDVRFIGESYALSTNVLHYQALRLAERLARERADSRAKQYAQWADALRTRIDQRFWREDAGQYMSYLGPAGARTADGAATTLLPVAKYDLLGLSLGVLAEVFPAERARRALQGYPATAAGSPVVWPQEADQPIYHNRAIWPFVSAYALRAARQLDDAPRIALEIESILRGAALAGSNMENYEMLSQAVHVDDGKLSGPVVNSQRQLWSVAGYLAMVREGVFGVMPDGRVAPKLPASLVPALFGARERITLDEGKHRYVLVRPARIEGELLVAGQVETQGEQTVVQLVARHDTASAPPQPAERFAPATPAAPVVAAAGKAWRVTVGADEVLWRDGIAQPAGTTQFALAPGMATCLRLTRRKGALESLPSPETCVGAEAQLQGAGHWQWTPPRAGVWRARLRYENLHGPINTGVTAAVKQLRVQCDGQPDQRLAVTMPHSVGPQDSTQVEFRAGPGACRITLEEGFNMSALAHFAHYTGGQGGRDGVVNDARVLGLTLVPLPVVEAAR